MPRTVKYFFAFASPFAALADARIDDLVAKAGAVLEPIPIVPPRQPAPTGLAGQLAEFKLSYLLEDAGRWAKQLGVPWKPPERNTVDGTDAAAGYYFARTQAKERGYRNAVFRARWSEGRDIDDPGVLGDCAAKAGLSRDAFSDALRTHQYHDEVPKALMLCMEDRIFGVPIFVVDGKRFWGNDRLDFLAAELRSPK
ncbi:MAG TPA: DsbA family protein [Myxococcota bacterium]|nr:DsbA family protein [Myxococcota bacterium]